MKWRPSPPELIASFEAAMPGPPAVQRQMFGYPAGFVNGRLFMGLHQEDMVLRLPEESRQRLLAVPGARVFEPMPGRPMREYVVVPPSVIARRGASPGGCGRRSSTRPRWRRSPAERLAAGGARRPGPVAAVPDQG